jgi:uncharacterized protein YidB (DUF937 family)
MFGAGMPRSGGGISPLTLALLGTLAYRTFKGKGRLADMLGTVRPAPAPVPENAPDAPLGGLLSPAALSGGLANLLNRFRLNGQGDKAESWVAQGDNKQIAPMELETALGEERITWLMEQTGLSRQDLLAGLSRSLPEAVDTLTPDGHIPSEQEARRLM